MTCRIGFIVRNHRVCFNDGDGGLTESMDELDKVYNFYYKTSVSRQVHITHCSREGKFIRLYYYFYYKPQVPVEHDRRVPSNSLLARYLKKHTIILDEIVQPRVL